MATYAAVTVLAAVAIVIVWGLYDYVMFYKEGV